jgi:hypothetical protein
MAFKFRISNVGEITCDDIGIGKRWFNIDFPVITGNRMDDSQDPAVFRFS